MQFATGTTLQPCPLLATYNLLMLYPKDPKVRVVRHEKTLKIEWNWGTKSGYVWLVLAGLVIVSMIYVMQAPNMNGDARGLGDIIGFSVLFGIIFVPMILGGLTAALNKTTIHADHERFLVRVGPFRWSKPKIIKASEIQQFFIGGHSSGQASFSKSLYLLDNESHYVLLTSIFPSSFAAHQICHELLDWYGFEDLPVYGESSLPHHPGPRLK
jgi:hypothetical protein